MNSEDRKGIVARVRSWIDKNTGFFWVCVIIVAVFFLVCLAYPELNPAGVFVFFFGCLVIAYLLRELMSREEKLSIVRNVLLDVALQECRCPPAGKGSCDVCEARAVLKEQFPGAIEFRIREMLGQWPTLEDSGLVSYVANPLYLSDWGGHIPEDLAASYLTPDEVAWYGEMERKWFDAHQAKPQ